MALKLSVVTGTLEKIDSELLIALVSRERAFFSEAGLVPLLAPIRSAYRQEKGQGDRLLVAPKGFNANQVLVCNVDNHKNLPFEEKIAAAVAAALHSAVAKGFRRTTLLFDQGLPFLEKALFGAFIGQYAFDRYKSRRDERFLSLSLFVRENERRETLRRLEQALEIAECIRETRDLVNEPANVATIEEVVRRARECARACGFKIKILEKKALQQQGLNGLLTVGRAGSGTPRLVILQYRPRVKSRHHLCLVGKGIIFDSGGICLKPPADMWTMKADMAGAATALYGMKAICKRKPDFSVSVILCLAENLPGTAAVRPGDIFRAANGKTVHVENTDAEGRLVLSDGLYMAGRLKATHIVDLATLTGGCIVALGDRIAGLMGNNRELNDKLIKASEISGERLWPLPLPDIYREMLDIHCADINNVGGTRSAHPILGGLFLREFVPEGAAWAHIDIAGPAFYKSKWKYFSEGATGYGIRLLDELARLL